MLAFNDLKRNNYCDKDSLFSSKKSYDYCLIESIGNCNRYWILFTKIQTSVVFFFFKENLMNTLLVKEGMTNCLHTRIRRIHLNETRNKGKNNHVLHSARNQRTCLFRSHDRFHQFDYVTRLFADDLDIFFYCIFSHFFSLAQIFLIYFLWFSFLLKIEKNSDRRGFV